MASCMGPPPRPTAAGRQSRHGRVGRTGGWAGRPAEWQEGTAHSSTRTAGAQGNTGARQVHKAVRRAVPHAPVPPRPWNRVSWMPRSLHTATSSSCALYRAQAAARRPASLPAGAARHSTVRGGQSVDQPHPTPHLHSLCSSAAPPPHRPTAPWIPSSAHPPESEYPSMISCLLSCTVDRCCAYHSLLQAGQEGRPGRKGGGGRLSGQVSCCTAGWPRSPTHPPTHPHECPIFIATRHPPPALSHNSPTQAQQTRT